MEKSIDENAFLSKSLNVEEARRNLHLLQYYIQERFANKASLGQSTVASIGQSSMTSCKLGKLGKQEHLIKDKQMALGTEFNHNVNRLQTRDDVSDSLETEVKKLSFSGYPCRHMLGVPNNFEVNFSIPTAGRNCKSLPDVITSLSSTSSDEIHSSPTPDVTIHEYEENTHPSCHELIRKQKQCVVIKGICSLPLLGRSDSQKSEKVDTSQGRQSERSVSISETITAKVLDGSVCPKDLENTKETVTSLKTPSEKYNNLRISSGYDNGQDGWSQDILKKRSNIVTQTSEENVSDLGLLQSSNDDKTLGTLNTAMRHYDVEKIKLSDDQGGCVNTSQFGSTFIDRPSAIEHDQNLKETVCVRPNISLFNTECSNLGKKDTNGNMPNVVAVESFSLPKSMIDKVGLEEANHRREVIKRCLEHTSLDIFSKSLSTGDFVQGSHNYNDVKEFEDVLERMSPSQIVAYLQLTSDSITPSPSPFAVEKYRMGELVDGLKYFTMEDLLKSSRCRYELCEELSCKKMAVIRNIFKLDLPEVDPNWNLVQAYCLLLWEHSQECEELACPVLYCSEIMSCQIDQASHGMVIELVKEHMQNMIQKPFMSHIHEGGIIVHKLMKGVQYQKPALFTTHIPLFTIDDSASVCLEVDTKRVCVIHDYPLLDYKHQMALYQRIATLNHANIVPHLWLVESNDNVIQVCSLFCQGGSLQDLLAGGQLPWEQCLYYIQQILEAVIYLQTKHGIVYLNWKSGNVQFPDCNRLRVQLGNFSLSCPLKSQCDVGAIKQCLPANICPPELLIMNKVDFPSDSWGAGCLLYEMFTGMPVLHHMRHEANVIIHNRVKAGLLHLTTHIPQEVNRVLQLCWEVEMDNRMCVQDIRQWATISSDSSSNRLAAK